jgi:hypothetical protein
VKLASTSRSASLLLLSALFACTPVQPPQHAMPAPSADPTTAPINEKDLRTRLYLIADDSMVGRSTGSIGHVKVTDYIAAEMKRLGLQPAGENGTYFQNVPFVKRAVNTNELNLDGAPLKARDEFVALMTGATHQPFSNIDVIYGGVIDDSTTWISAEQGAGKFVVFRLSSMQVLQRGIPAGNAEKRFTNAAATAITGFGPVYPQIANYYSSVAGIQRKNPNAPTGMRPVQYFISDATAEKLLGAPASTLQPGAPGKKVTGRFEHVEDVVVARNVIAILPGSDANLKGTYVAIGAHSDHDPISTRAFDHDSMKVFNTELRKLTVQLGRNPTAQERAAIKINLDSIRKLRAPRRDSIKNGADDDGSGTVAVLEIAEAMAKGNAKPKRSVLFIWHVAEELGLIGSAYFTDNPTVPRDSIVATLNIDMIGRGGPGEEPAGGPDYLQLIGWRRLSNELGDITEAVNRERRLPFKFDLTYDAPGHPEQYYCRSDHYMYARYGIPIVFFSTGDHGDYHQVTDEPQYIDYSKLMNVTQLIHDIALRVGNLDHRPVVDGPRPDPKGQCRQ